MRPIVRATITDAALALDPESRYFQRLRRRLDHPLPAVTPCAAAEDIGGRMATWWQHLVPVNVAMTRFLMIVYRHCSDRDQRDQLAVGLLDDCLAAVRPSPARSAPDVPLCLV